MSRFGLGFISGDVPGNDSFTKSLLHFDGTNGSATFPDVNVGGSAKTWTAYNSFGTSTLTTAKSKFGPSSVTFSNTLTAVKTPPHADFNVGSGNFTIDFWYNSITTGSAICGQGDASFANISMFVGQSFGRPRLRVSTGAAFVDVTGTTNLNAGVWNHLAFVRASGVLKLFVNGIQEGGNVSGAFSVPSSSANWAVGLCGDDTSQFSTVGSCIDEFRFSNGIARWTANFTPPTAAYT